MFDKIEILSLRNGNCQNSENEIEQFNWSNLIPKNKIL